MINAQWSAVATHGRRTLTLTKQLLQLSEYVFKYLGHNRSKFQGPGPSPAAFRIATKFVADSTMYHHPLVDGVASGLSGCRSGPLKSPPTDWHMIHDGYQ